MDRILILGCPCSGKSTLARALARQSGLPIIHLDREYWKSGWVEPSHDEWNAKVDLLLQQTRWLMDGNYTNTIAQRAAVADAIVFLDLPTRICLWRCLWRVARGYGRVRDDMQEGCPERFDLEFIAYIASFRQRQRPKLVDVIAGFRGTVVLLRNAREVAVFAQRCGNDGLDTALRTSH